LYRVRNVPLRIGKGMLRLAARAACDTKGKHADGEKINGDDAEHGR
jgi:hypothetical protein